MVRTPQTRRCSRRGTGGWLRGPGARVGRAHHVRALEMNPHRQRAPALREQGCRVVQDTRFVCSWLLLCLLALTDRIRFLNRPSRDSSGRNEAEQSSRPPSRPNVSSIGKFLWPLCLVQIGNKDCGSLSAPVHQHVCPAPNRWSFSLWRVRPRRSCWRTAQAGSEAALSGAASASPCLAPETRRRVGDARGAESENLARRYLRGFRPQPAQRDCEDSRDARRLRDRTAFCRDTPATRLPFHRQGRTASPARIAGRCKPCRGHVPHTVAGRASSRRSLGGTWPRILC